MTFVVLPGRPPHPGIVQDDVIDVWKSSGRLWHSRRRTTGKIVGRQSGLLRAASWQQGNLRDGAEYGPTAVCRTGIYTLWTIYDCLIITSVSRECLRPIGLMGAFAGAGGRCLPTARARAHTFLENESIICDKNFWAGPADTHAYTASVTALGFRSFL